MEITHFPSNDQFLDLPHEVRAFAELMLASSKPLLCGELNLEIYGESNPGVTHEYRDNQGIWSLSLHILEGRAFISGSLYEISGNAVAFGIHTE